MAGRGNPVRSHLKAGRLTAEWQREAVGRNSAKVLRSDARWAPSQAGRAGRRAAASTPLYVTELLASQAAHSCLVWPRACRGLRRPPSAIGQGCSARRVATPAQLVVDSRTPTRSGRKDRRGRSRGDARLEPFKEIVAGSGIAFEEGSEHELAGVPNTSRLFTASTPDPKCGRRRLARVPPGMDLPAELSGPL
jgi:hypothetical protein